VSSTTAIIAGTISANSVQARRGAGKICDRRGDCQRRGSGSSLTSSRSIENYGMDQSESCHRRGWLSCSRFSIIKTPRRRDRLRPPSAIGRTGGSAGAAESRAQELEQQTASILETESSQQRTWSDCGRRRPSPGSQSLAGAHAPSTLLAATLSDPDAREALRGVVHSQSHPGPLIEGLKLDKEKAEKLLGIGAIGPEKFETVVAFTEGPDG